MRESIYRIFARMLSMRNLEGETREERIHCGLSRCDTRNGKRKRNAKFVFFFGMR